MTEQTWTHTEEERREIHRLTTPGPWDDEPDKVQWIDPDSDLDCLALRNRLGVWCGYVGLPPGHPLHGQAVDEDDFDVHGGVTFRGSLCDEEAPEGHGICHVPLPGRPADVWWVGFDCGHAFDVMPAFMEYEKGTGHEPLWPRSVYRDLGYVKGETARLARQLADRG